MYNKSTIMVLEIKRIRSYLNRKIETTVKESTEETVYCCFEETINDCLIYSSKCYMNFVRHDMVLSFELLVLEKTNII